MLTGHVRQGSDIDLHVFADGPGLVSTNLDDHGLIHEFERKRVVKFGEARTFTHIHIPDRFAFELTLYPEEKFHYVFKSSITGRPIETASIAELEAILRSEDPDADLDAEVDHLDDLVDRFELYRLLLLPLEGVKQSPRYHPEGDALFHSLQFFELALLERGSDEEFLLAALLHDVGKAIDPADHVTAGLQALEGTNTERTTWLIEHHMDALKAREGTLGAREWERLQRSEEFEDLMLLRDLDLRGRQPGAIVRELDEALAYLRNLEAENDGDG